MKNVIDSKIAGACRIVHAITDFTVACEFGLVAELQLARDQLMIERNGSDTPVLEFIDAAIKFLDTMIDQTLKGE